MTTNMMMSSLQQRVLEASKLATSKINDNNHKPESFETRFSAGLDLTEFNNGGDERVPVHSASADLARLKASDAARRNREEKAEAELEQRVADVVHAVKNSLTAAKSRDIHVPLAVHPKNNKNDGKQGNYRDDNFVQFQNDASISGGFLSSLVSNHKNEEQLETISHKSRQLMNQRKTGPSSRSSSVGSVGGGGISKPRRQLAKAKNSKQNHIRGKVALAKKHRISKH